MKILKKIFYYSGLTTLLFLVFSILVYLIWGHPNDSRVKSISLDSLKIDEKRFTSLGSLFESNWPLNLNITTQTYQKKLTDLHVVYKNHLTINSARFRSPWQIFFTLGSHPDYLEGRHSIAIPAGTIAIFNLPTHSQGAYLSYGLAAVAANKVIFNFQVANQKWSTVLSPITQARNSENFWHKNFGRFLFPDGEIPGGSWYDENFLLSQSSSQGNQSVSIECRSNEPNAWCIVSEPSLWENIKNDKLNFLMILVDTLRYDGISEKHSPTMNNLKNQGITFEKALAPGNMTTPSTNGILSCQSPSKIGDIAFSYATTTQILESHYQKAKPSFAHFFSKAGWKTAMIGNISVISDVMGIAVDHGFKEQIAIEQPGYDTPHITKSAIKWLETNQNKPFFLYLHYHSPHAPYRAPLKDIFSTYPGAQAFANMNDILKWLYAGEVHYTDRYLNQLFESLDKLNLTENTVILLTADHGDQHELRTFTGNEAGPAYVGSYFDHGATLLNDEIHVPLIVKKPNQLPQSIDTLVSGIDIGPTLLSIANLDIPSWCNGISLKPFINNEPKEFYSDRIISSEGFQQRAIIWDQRYKYIRSYQPTEKRLYSPSNWKSFNTQVFIEEQIFDLNEDPHELNNLISNKSLKDQARQLFKHHFNLKEIYELVIENPKQKDVAIVIKNPNIIDINQIPQSNIHDNIIQYKEEKRIQITMNYFSDADLDIIIDGKKIEPGLTSLRLKIPFHEISSIPLEIGIHTDLLPLARRQTAYIRRIETGDIKTRTMITGNPKFQKILREWGYLNDSN